MNRADIRSKKRKEVVEAIILRNESIVLFSRIYNLPQRTIFRWLARYRNGGWHALTESNRKGLTEACEKLGEGGIFQRSKRCLNTIHLRNLP